MHILSTYLSWLKLNNYWPIFVWLMLHVTFSAKNSAAYLPTGLYSACSTLKTATQYPHKSNKSYTTSIYFTHTHTYTRMHTNKKNTHKQTHKYIHNTTRYQRCCGFLSKRRQIGSESIFSPVQKRNALKRLQTGEGREGREREGREG